MGIAAQSIGEPGTQLTLRTFHVGGTASNIAISFKIEGKFDGRLEIEELRFVEYEGGDQTYDMVIGRSAEMKIIDKQTGVILASNNIPYGSKLYVKNAWILRKVN